MNILRYAMVPLCTALLLAGSVAAQEPRVKGADLVTEGRAIDEIVPDLMPVALSQEEIDLFLKSAGPVGTWVQANAKAWNDVGEGDEKQFLTRLIALPVWATAGITAPEFLALMLKLASAHTAAQVSTKEQAAQLQAMLAEMEKAGTDEAQSAEDKAEAAKQLGQLKKMIDALQKYPEANTELYKKNQAALDAALERLQPGSEDGGGMEPGEGGDAPKEGGK